MMTLCSRLWIIGLLAAIPSVALAVDGTPSFNPGTDSGLYVWRTSSGAWQVRVLAADGNRQVRGSFQTGEQVGWTNRIALESNDTMQVSTANTVDFDVKTEQFTVDGLAFGAGSGGVCLRTSTAVPIYLGKDAVPAASPVDLTSSGACAADLPQVSGLDVFRSSQFQWRVELSAEDGPMEFDGVLEFSDPLLSYRGQYLSGPDELTQPAPDRLAMRLHTWPGGRDVVTFTTAEFTRVCLRSSSAAEQTILLSSVGQAEPFQVTTPVDLTNNGACGLPADPFPPPTHGRKFNPGHYVTLTDLDGEVELAESLVNGVVGFSRRYDWREIEPWFGHYDFSAIEADLALAEAYGLQYVVMIRDKSFTNQSPAPDYLANYVLPNRPGGFTVARWQPYVVERYNAMIEALGQRFDSHPNFEGLATAESAPGIEQDDLQASNYSAEKHRDALIEMLTSASESLPSSRVFWYMNFLPGANYYMGEIARAVAPFGVVMGGPDVLPDAFPLQIHPYPFYDGAVGNMPLFTQVEPVCYHHLHADTSYPTRFWTPPELIEFARDELHVSYMFWVRWRWRVPSDAYNWWDAMPAIENTPEFNLD